MSYSKAKACFKENVDAFGDNPMSDPQTYNLNQGLLILTKEIDTSITEINRKLTSILAALQRR